MGAGGASREASENPKEAVRPEGLCTILTKGGKLRSDQTRGRGLGARGCKL